MKSIKLLLILVSLNLSAQDFDQRFAVTIFNSPYAWMQGDGANLGANIQYQHPFVYAGAETFVYPDLKGYDYVHFIGTFGGSFNIKNRLDRAILRAFGGFRGGGIYRDGSMHGLLGFEFGGQWNLTSKFFVGLRGAYDFRGDSMVWSNESYFEQYSTFAEFGFRW